MVENHNSLLIIITARMGSKRFPGKVLKPFWGEYSILEFLIKRLQQRKETSHLVLAIPGTSENDLLEDLGIRLGIRVIRGPEQNVLTRMGLCLNGENVGFVARVTADNPFTDPSLMILQHEKMMINKADYSYCKKSPKGTAADIWGIECFKNTIKNASTLYELEHANAWNWNNESHCSVLWFDPPVEYMNPNLNLSIDTDEDYYRVRQYAYGYNRPLEVYMYGKHL